MIFVILMLLTDSGKVREKFPLEMAEIQGAVVAADINDDGKIELVTADAHGNVAAWTPQGKEIWETHVKSLVPQVIPISRPLIMVLFELYMPIL